MVGLRTLIETVARNEVFWLYVAVVAITSVEKHRIGWAEETSFFLRVVFEVVSAYGNVGLSLGTKGIVSFAAELSGFSQKILILLMLIGKLRNCVPQDVDDYFLSHVSVEVEDGEEMTETLPPESVSESQPLRDAATG